MWVDKYKPKSTAELIGQARNVARIKTWLKTFEPAQSRPLFLYGPPGIGKTTAAHLCCKEVGYKTVEFNASDQRNKNTIKDVINVLAGNSRLNFFGRASETKDAIILDEIDGMAGNEDRGGIAQLIIEMQKTKKPMIFVCNDGQHQKLRSLKDKCEVVEFRRPDYDSIRAVVTRIAKQEDLKVQNIDVKQLAESSDFDIRQVINSLSLFRDGNVEKLVKTTRLNAFESTKRVFTRTSPPMSLDDRFDCFFADYNIMPLFVFENYVKNQPTGDQLRAISRAADAQCFGDLADKEIRTNQNWSLLNTQALFSTVIPSSMTQSLNVGRTDFPQFLGKLSNSNKRARLTQELNAHMCLSLRNGLDPDYLEVMRDRLSVPLIKKGTGGVDVVIDFMHEYSLLREDFNSIMELSSWSFKPDPMTKVDTKTKLAFTNSYKKRPISMPYFVDDNMPKKRKVTTYTAESGGEEEADNDEDDEPVIKPKKKTQNKSVNKKAEKKPAKEKPEKAATGEAKQEKSKPTQQAADKVADKPTKQRNGRSNGKVKHDANTTIDILSDSDEDTQPLPTETTSKATTNGATNDKKTTSKPDKRPPAPVGGGILRFFSAKKQKSS